MAEARYDQDVRRDKDLLPYVYATLPEREFGDVQFDGELVFGNGEDGDVTISADTSLSEDMYYNNLTVNSGTNLVTNGFRVFVKETLTNNGTIGLPAAFGGETGIGTLVGRVKDGTSGVPKSYVLGESAGGTQVSAGLLRNLDLVTRGWHIDPTDGFKRIEGCQYRCRRKWIGTPGI